MIQSIAERQRRHAARAARAAVTRNRGAGRAPLFDLALVVIDPGSAPRVALGTTPQVRAAFSRLADAPAPHRQPTVGAPARYVATFRVDAPNWHIPEQEAWADPPPATPPGPPPRVQGWYMFPAWTYPEGIPGL